MGETDREPWTEVPYWHPPIDKPTIDITNLGLADLSAAAWEAIDRANWPPRIYRYGSGIGWLILDVEGVPQVDLMNDAAVRHHLAQVATFLRWTPAGKGRPAEQKPAYPPTVLTADLLIMPSPSLPVLKRLVRTPVFLRDGRMLTAPGYDSNSKLYFAPPDALALPNIAVAPTDTDIANAVALLTRDLLVDFPFYGASDTAHALALLLTPFLRDLIPGNVPLFVVSKPTPRTGAGLLLKVLSRIQSGTPVAPTTITREEEENRKKLMSFLIQSPALILLDNLHGRLESPTLASILTSGPTWSDRMLGTMERITVPNTATFVLTGNNVTLSNEMAGRSVLIRLDPQVEDPGTRSGFKHERLEAWVMQHRPVLVAACLTLGQAWVAKGMPAGHPGSFGGYEEWADVVSGVLDVCGIPGFLGNREALYIATDDSTGILKGFLLDWWTVKGTTPQRTKDLLPLAQQHELEITAKTEQGTLVKLGKLIGQDVDRPYTIEEGLTVTIRRAGTGHRKAPLWRLQRAGGDGGDGNSTPSTIPSTESAKDLGDLPGLGGDEGMFRHDRARVQARTPVRGEVSSPPFPPSPPEDIEVEMWEASQAEEETPPRPDPGADGPHGDACDCRECLP